MTVQLADDVDAEEADADENEEEEDDEDEDEEEEEDEDEEETGSQTGSQYLLKSGTSALCLLKNKHHIPQNPFIFNSYVVNSFSNFTCVIPRKYDRGCVNFFTAHAVTLQHVVAVKILSLI